MTDDAPIKIEPKAKDRRTVAFEIGDDIFEFRVPKSYSLMQAIRGMQADGSGTAEIEMYHRIEDWLFSSCEDSDKLRDRLADPDDDLDTDTIVEMFQQLVKAASNRPSGLRRSAS